MSAESSASASPFTALASLRGLRRAPDLEPGEARQLRSELDRHLAACDWFTIGVMAPTASAAAGCLGALEQALGWSPLVSDPAAADPGDDEGAVFLKGNQSSGRFLVRREAGLGEGILITGHGAVHPEAEDTWGPLPLDLLAQHDG